MMKLKKRSVDNDGHASDVSESKRIKEHGKSSRGRTLHCQHKSFKDMQATVGTKFTQPKNRPDNLLKKLDIKPETKKRNSQCILEFRIC